MVRYLYILFFVLFISPSFAKAQDVSFDAYIDRESVSVGETFQVKLELINAQADAAPDLSVLPSDVQVLGQQQQQNVSIINGNQAQSLSWVLDVVAEKEGTFKIPSIEIKTNAGPLYTKPFKIFVKPASQLSASTSDNSVFIDVQADKQDPYIDEPVLYKTMVYHLGDIQNAELVKPKAENAIVEQLTEPKPSKQILNGINYKVIEVEYLITPIKTGDVTVEPSVLRGKIAQNSQSPTTPMDELFAPFGGNAGAPMKEYAPFTVASNKYTFNVKPAEAGVNPWLTLYDLQIDDELGDVEYDKTNNRILAKMGEPITRRVRMVAYGKGGEALPEIDASFNSPDFKVYSDKAESTKEVVAGDDVITARIKGTKIQTFTFIPQKTGMVTLPELNITYWSLKDNKIAKANLPGKVITSVPSDKVAQNNNTAQPQQPKPAEAAKTQDAADNAEAPTQEKTLEAKLEELTNSPQAPNFVLLLISFVICVVMLITIKVLTQAKLGKEDFDEDLINPKKAMQADKKRIAGRRVVENSPQKNASNPRKIINFNSKNKSDVAASSSTIVAIKAADNHIKLQEELQKFATKYLNLSRNAGTVIIAVELSKKFGVDKQAAMKYAAELDSVLYAGKQIDLDYLKNAFAEIIAEAEAKMSSSSNGGKKDDGLTALNP